MRAYDIDPFCFSTGNLPLSDPSDHGGCLRCPFPKIEPGHKKNTNVSQWGCRTVFVVWGRREGRADGKGGEEEEEGKRSKREEAVAEHEENRFVFHLGLGTTAFPGRKREDARGKTAMSRTPRSSGPGGTELRAAPHHFLCRGTHPRTANSLPPTVKTERPVYSRAPAKNTTLVFS